MDKERLKRLKAVNSELELLSLVKGLGWEALNSREIDVLAKALERCLDKPDMRIAYLASHTIDPLPSYIAAGALVEGIKLSSYVGPFNQYVQEVLDTSSDFHVFDPDLVLLSTQMADLCPRVHYDFASLSGEETDAEQNWIITHLRDWASAALKSTKATVLVPNFSETRLPESRDRGCKARTRRKRVLFVLKPRAVENVQAPTTGACVRFGSHGVSLRF